MNLPNKLTVFRIILIPIFVFLMLTKIVPYGNIYAGFVFILACVTDFLDGYLARKYNLITTFGKFMDPLADKLLVCAALVCFVAADDIRMPVWIAIIIISREFIISGYRLVAVEKGVVISASIWGKVKTVVQMVMSCILIFNVPLTFFYICGQISIYLSLVFTVISLVDYIYKNIDVMKDND